MSWQDLMWMLRAELEDLLEKKGRLVLAIDGRCASGKSSLAAQIAGWMPDSTNVFHADDYFLPLPMRTSQRMAEPGGNMHRERLEAEILARLGAGEPFSYTPFDCGIMDLGQPVAVQPKALSIVEGSYSMHPDLRRYYDMSIFLTVEPQVQLERILERNGPEKLEVFREKWIPLEERYFRECKVAQACSLRFDTSAWKN